MGLLLPQKASLWGFLHRTKCFKLSVRLFVAFHLNPYQEASMSKPRRLLKQIAFGPGMRLLILAAILSLVWACYPASEVSYSRPQELRVSQWLIEVKPSEAKVQLTMQYRRERDSGFSYSNTGFGVSLDQLIGLTREQIMSNGSHVQFQLKRDAGTFNFEGWFRQGNGSGHFTFTPNASFAAELNRQGFGKPTDDQLLSMALSDVGFALINELRAQGYETPTLEQLVKMGNHGVRIEYLQGLKALGYSLKSVDLLVRMKDHGVSLNFIRELGDLGYSGLSPEELVRTKDHGVNAQYIREFMSAGYERRPLNEWITMKDHGVTTRYIDELKTLGYSGVALDDLRRMKDHGVNPSFVKELKELGYERVPIEQLIRLRDHGVSASYIRNMKQKGYGDLTLDEFIRLRDRGEKDE